jgi:holliday junction DNA helicase RuvA
MPCVNLLTCVLGSLFGSCMMLHPFQSQCNMIGRLSGILLEKNPPQLLVDCNGVGYEVSVPMSTFYNLPGVGEKAVLLTHLIVREDAHLLYGFGNTQEREVFRELIKISGIGARTALAILSGMSVNDLAQSVSMQEAGRLTRVPGIGKKTAERLLLELKGKLGADLGGAPAAAATDNGADILNALVALGYSDKEATLALKQVPAGAGVSDGIKAALKALSKA